MKLNHLYLHENCRDAAIMPLRIDEDGEYLLINCLWWNVGTCHEPWLMGPGADDIKVKKADLSKWKQIEGNYRCPPLKMTTL